MAGWRKRDGDDGAGPGRGATARFLTDHSTDLPAVSEESHENGVQIFFGNKVKELKNGRQKPQNSKLGWKISHDLSWF